MRGARNRRAMTPIVDIETLVSEIQRYLAAVDAFRDEGRSPHWRRERSERSLCAPESHLGQFGQPRVSGV